VGRRLRSREKQPLSAEQLKQMSIAFYGEQVTFDQPVDGTFWNP
jgi:hypothetical protein